MKVQRNTLSKDKIRIIIKNKNINNKLNFKMIAITNKSLMMNMKISFNNDHTFQCLIYTKRYHEKLLNTKRNDHIFA